MIGRAEEGWAVPPSLMEQGGDPSAPPPLDRSKPTLVSSGRLLAAPSDRRPGMPCPRLSDRELTSTRRKEATTFRSHDFGTGCKSWGEL
jgi:hypothetical protein